MSSLEMIWFAKFHWYPPSLAQTSDNPVWISIQSGEISFTTPSENMGPISNRWIQVVERDDFVLGTVTWIAWYDSIDIWWFPVDLEVPLK